MIRPQHATMLFTVSSLKITNIGTIQNPVCDFLVVICTDLHFVLHCFRDITDNWLLTRVVDSLSPKIWTYLICLTLSAGRKIRSTLCQSNGRLCWSSVPLVAFHNVASTLLPVWNGLNVVIVACCMADCESAATTESTGAGTWTLDAGDAADADEVRERITGLLCVTLVSK